MGSSVSQHLGKLLEQKETPLWGGYVNMLKTLESLFQSPKHWVLEFLQNAEDASKDEKDSCLKKISIQIGDDFLQIFNNGKIFDEKDFKTICDVKSQKLPSLGFRGYIGIGFKSIFRVTNRIDIHSGEYHFKFDKLYWDDSKKEGLTLSEWPWEILPIEIESKVLPEGYTTGFYIPLSNLKGIELLKEIENFFIHDFPKEAILMLEHISIIEIQTPQLSFVVTKKPDDDSSIICPIGKQDMFIVEKQVDGQRYPEKSYYLVFKETVPVDEKILKDEETERVRRSNVKDRDIGVVFELNNSENNIQPLTGKLAGVYSFLPVEGEQTGLPLGIFGDFIPLPGRDLISYGAKWNHWMCDELVKFFKRIVQEVFLSHEQWRVFPSVLLERLQYSNLSGESEKFWGTKLRNPIKDFLESEDCYFDADGNRRKLEELMIVDKEIEEIVGKNNLEEITGKKIVHPRIRKSIQLKIKDENSIQKYNITSKKKIIESLKRQPEKLVKIYQLRDISPSHSDSFVLAEDGDLYTLVEVVNPRIDLDNVAKSLKPVIPQNKKLLHPEIAKDPEALEALKRFGVKDIDEKQAIQDIEKIINSIINQQKCPECWNYPDDIIEATLFIISKGGGSTLRRLFAQDGTFHENGELFIPAAPLDWFPLWEAHLLPGYQPIHKKYLIGQNLDNASQYFRELGVHGFDREKDKGLIETAAYAIAEKKLTGDSHRLARVTQRDKLGYDYQCQGHCEKVFEVKGMGEPKDLPLQPSEWRAATEKREDCVLICVYNLPNHPDKVKYKERANFADICKPIERAIVPKDKWLSS